MGKAFLGILAVLAQLEREQISQRVADALAYKRSQGKLLGTLVTRHAVSHTSILVSPDYLRLRSTLVDALRPFPAANATG